MHKKIKFKSSSHSVINLFLSCRFNANSGLNDIIYIFATEDKNLSRIIF